MTATAERLNLRDFPPVEENIERPETLSQSLLAQHDNCPRAAYLARRYSRASVEMDRGTALHQTIERAEKLMLDQEERTIPGDVARQIAEEVMAERTDLVLPAREQDRVRAMAWNWAESPLGGVDPETILGIELPLHLELGGFTLTCRIDRVEAAGSTLYVFDYKSGFPGRREEAEESFQGKFYGSALLFGTNPETGMGLGDGINDVWFYEVFPRRRDEETGDLIVLEGVWSRTELFEFKSSLERNVAAFERSLETGDWPARDGSWCGRCPAQSECPIPPHLREVEQITTVAEAEAAFSAKQANEREGRRLQTGLREWVKQNGAVYSGDQAFDAQISTSKEVKNWGELELAIHRTVEMGAPFRQQDHVRPKTSTKYAKRKLTEEEKADAA